MQEGGGARAAEPPGALVGSRRHARERLWRELFPAFGRRRLVRPGAAWCGRILRTALGPKAAGRHWPALERRGYFWSAIIGVRSDRLSSLGVANHSLSATSPAPCKTHFVKRALLARHDSYAATTLLVRGTIQVVLLLPIIIIIHASKLLWLMRLWTTPSSGSPGASSLITIY
jgi:hypothetical protein